MADVIELVAHRGNARDFPENTLPALRSALDLGLRHIEFDVQLAADLTPVLMHDDTLERTTGLPGSVFELQGAELAAIEAAERARFGERHAGTCIPLLEQAVQLIEAHPQAIAFVEIKRASLRRFGEEQVLARVLQALQPVRSRCVIISFDLPAIHLARKGGHDIGWVLSEYDDHTRLKCEALQPRFLFCNHLRLPADDSRLWRGPWVWALYEVDESRLARSLIARGARLIETMAVAPMAAALRNAPRPA
jgi:glycerophosphoryl diester phosphodiesterase